MRKGKKTKAGNGDLVTKRYMKVGVDTRHIESAILYRARCNEPWNYKLRRSTKLESLYFGLWIRFESVSTDRVYIITIDNQKGKIGDELSDSQSSNF